MPIISNNSSPSVVVDTTSPTVADVADDVAAAAPAAPVVDAIIDTPVREAGALPSAPSVVDPTTSPIATRLAHLAGESAQALVERREVYAGLIAQHTATTATLGTEIQTIRTRINEKTNEANSYLSRQQRLISEISEKQKAATVAGVYGGALAFFTFGASAVIGGATAAACAAAILNLRANLSDVESRKRSVERELDNLKRASTNFEAQQADLGRRLEQLKGAQAELVGQASPALPVSAPLDQLKRATETDRKIVVNLEAQIAILHTMRASATGFEAALDTLIAALKRDVEALTAQLARTNRALVVALIDVALTGFGATRALKLEGLSLARKDVVMATVDFASGDAAALASTLVNALVKEGVVAATGSAVLAATMLTLLNKATSDSSAAVTAMLGTAPALTAVQRDLLGALAAEKQINVEVVAAAVVADPAIDSERAEAVKALLRT